MATAELEIALTGIDKSLRSLETFGKQSTSILGGIESSLKSLGGIAAAAFAGFSVKAIVDAAVESDQAIKRLNLSLASSGDFTEESSKEFQKLASEIQKTSGITDEQTIALIGNAKAIGLTNAETIKLTKASVDVAAIMGTDVNGSFQELERTLSGTLSKGLRNRFPELRNLSAEALANGEAIKILGERYAGAAASLNQDFGGQLKGVGLSFGEVLESIGKIITQNTVFVQALSKLKNVLFDLAETIAENVGPAIDFINKVIGFFIKGILEIASVESGVIAVFVDLSRAAITFGSALSTVFKIIVEAISPIREFASLLFDSIAVALSQITKIVKLAAAGFLELFKVIAKLRGQTDSVNELQSKIDDLYGSISNQDAAIKATATSIKKESVEISKQIDLVTKQESQTVEFTNASVKASTLRRQALEKEFAAQQRIVAEQQKALVQSAAQSPVQFFATGQQQLEKFSQTKGVSPEQVGAAQSQATGAQALGLAGQALQGPQGATNIITQALGAFADTILPGIGSVVTQIASVLAQGPEAAASFVRGFLESIPVIIENIVLSIPAVIDALIVGSVKLIDRLVELAPQLAVKLGVSLANQAPSIATRLTVELIKNIPTIVNSLAKGVFEAIKEILKPENLLAGIPGGDFLGGIVSDIGGFFGFQTGGKVPGGAPFSDRIPALLTPGETVVDREDTQKLADFLNGRSQVENGQATNLTVNLMVGENELASVILDLNRRGFRLA